MKFVKLENKKIYTLKCHFIQVSSVFWSMKVKIDYDFVTTHTHTVCPQFIYNFVFFIIARVVRVMY